MLMKKKERENRVMALPITWEIVKEYIIDKIEGLPKDVEIIGIRHDIFTNCDVIGVCSKKFKKVDLGIKPDHLHLYYERENHPDGSPITTKLKVDWK